MAAGGGLYWVFIICSPSECAKTFQNKYILFRLGWFKILLLIFISFQTVCVRQFLNQGKKRKERNTGLTEGPTLQSPALIKISGKTSFDFGGNWIFSACFEGVKGRIYASKRQIYLIAFNSKAVVRYISSLPPLLTDGNVSTYLSHFLQELVLNYIPCGRMKGRWVLVSSSCVSGQVTTAIAY